MNKGEFLDALYEANKDYVPSKAAMKKIMESGLEIAVDSIKKGEGLQFAGFGSLNVVKRAARKGVNPQTKEPIKIKARKAVKFTPGKIMKEAAEKAKTAK